MLKVEGFWGCLRLGSCASPCQNPVSSIEHPATSEEDDEHEDEEDFRWPLIKTAVFRPLAAAVSF